MSWSWSHTRTRCITPAATTCAFSLSQATVPWPWLSATTVFRSASAETSRSTRGNGSAHPRRLGITGWATGKLFDGLCAWLPGAGPAHRQSSSPGLPAAGADASKRGQRYEALGIAIGYEHTTRTTTVRSRPSSPYRQWLRPRGIWTNTPRLTPIVAQLELHSS